MEFKGTKDKWRIVRETNANNDYITILAGYSTGICGIFGKESNENKLSEEQLANAKLIASAPKLLEALIRIYKINNKVTRLTRNEELEISDIALAAIKVALEEK